MSKDEYIALYSEMPNERLMLLRAEDDALVPEAVEALHVELQKRGITDTDTMEYVEQYVAESIAEEQSREMAIGIGARIVRFLFGRLLR